MLIRRARAGDADALNVLLQRYLPRLRRWATGRLPPSARDLLDTGDVVQETLVKAVRNFDRIEISDDGALQAYLRRALVNRLRDVYRQTTIRPTQVLLESDIPATDQSPLQAAVGSETLERYEVGLARLTEGDRQAVILRIEMCYDYRQIADMLGKPTADAARMTVSRALARLSREMKR